MSTSSSRPAAVEETASFLFAPTKISLELPLARTFISYSNTVISSGCGALIGQA